MRETKLTLFGTEELQTKENDQNVKSTSASLSSLNTTFDEKEFAIKQAFQSLTLEPDTNSKASKARQVLGQDANRLSDDQLETFVSQFEYLVDSWLNLYEQQLFDGKTLKELLNSDEL